MKNTLAENLLRFGAKNLSEESKRKLTEAVQQPIYWNFPLVLSWYNMAAQAGTIEYMKIPDSEIVFFNSKPISEPTVKTPIETAIGGANRVVCNLGQSGTYMVIGNTATGTLGAPSITSAKVMMNVGPVKRVSLVDQADVDTSQRISTRINVSKSVNPVFETFLIDAYRTMFPSDTTVNETNANGSAFKQLIKVCVAQKWVNEASDENKQKYLRRTPNEIAAWNPYNMLLDTWR